VVTVPIPPRRYPRKYKKKHCSKIELDLSYEDLARLKADAREHGMRLNQYINYALLMALDGK